MASECFLGLDFGTESVRALIVDRQGRELGSAVESYTHGQIVPGSAQARRMFPPDLPPHFALQHPQDWLDSAIKAIREACAAIDPATVAGIGVDFTSCTMLPCDRAGMPLAAARPDLASRPHAWPKLWKHHGALHACDTINRIARDMNEPWLARYGGLVGLEWLFPKMLEVIESDPEVADAAELWIEAGDWLVWQIAGGRGEPARSTCQAGYKGCWSPLDGYPGRAFLAACHQGLLEVIDHKLPGRHLAPGTPAGEVSESFAARTGLRVGVPVSAAIIDAHAGVPGAGVAEEGALVMVLGTSGCHMLMAKEERLIPGVAGIVRDGILPGFVGYETGQAAMGDAFDWARRLVGASDFASLDHAARAVPAGSDGLVMLDWLNGCRTPLMDGSLTGVITGLTLHHTPAHVYRAALESSAMGLRWIVTILREGHVPVTRFVATGGLPRHNPLFVEIIASALGAPVEVHGARHGPALGAAILGACAAGAFNSVHEAAHSMAGSGSALPPSRVIFPNPTHRDAYDQLFERYLHLADTIR